MKMNTASTIEKSTLESKKVYMPWMELIAAFLEAIPYRRERQAECLNNNPLFNLREFHVLTIGGPRQCGKTQAVVSLLEGNPDARFIRNSNGYLPDQIKNNPELLERTFVKVGITKEMLEGVTILVMDNDGRPEDEMSPYRMLETMYAIHTDWFDPDLVVIRVL
jgi:hypothetical protein